QGRITPRDTGMWNEAQQEAWEPVVSSLRSRGTVAGIQLSHAGRKGSAWWPFSEHKGTVSPRAGGWQTVAPSTVPHEDFTTPREIQASEIDELVSAFARSAARAVAIGFEVVEIHAAHGYLLHQFLSPLSNLRED